MEFQNRLDFGDPPGHFDPPRRRRYCYCLPPARPSAGKKTRSRIKITPQNSDFEGENRDEMSDFNKIKVFYTKVLN